MCIRDSIGPEPFTLKVNIVFNFIFSCDEIEMILFCTTDLSISCRHRVSNFIGVTNQFTIVLNVLDRLKHWCALIWPSSILLSCYGRDTGFPAWLFCSEYCSTGDGLKSLKTDVIIFSQCLFIPIYDSLLLSYFCLLYTSITKLLITTRLRKHIQILFPYNLYET